MTSVTYSPLLTPSPPVSSLNAVTASWMRACSSGLRLPSALYTYTPTVAGAPRLVDQPTVCPTPGMTPLTPAIRARLVPAALVVALGLLMEAVVPFGS